MDIQFEEAPLLVNELYTSFDGFNDEKQTKCLCWTKKYFFF